MTEYIIYIATGASAILGLHTLSKTRIDYTKRGKLTTKTSISWWIVDMA